MERTRKKGFTIVELVIVIAVIAILAAVLIPTFANIIEKANQSTDIQLIKNLNTALQVELNSQGISGKYLFETPYDAVSMCASGGYLVNTIVAKSHLDIAYSMDEGIFVLVNTETGEIVFPTEDGVEKTSALGQEERYFIFRSSLPTGENEKKYSIFAGDSWKDEEVALDGIGFDVGYRTEIKKVDYKNTTGNAKDIVIRTDSLGTKISIDGEKDTVSHYGYAAEINVINVNNTACFDEFGTTGRLIYKDDLGKVTIKDGARVFCYMNVSTDANMDSEKIVVSNGVNYSYVNSAEAAQAKSAGQDVNEVTRGTLTLKLGKDGTVLVSECDAHKSSENYEVFDTKTGVYIVCKKCGAYCHYHEGKIEDHSDGISEENDNIFVITPVTTITLNETSVELVVGGQITLTAEVLPADATIKSVYWVSADPKIATVDNGEVVAVSVGTTTIKAIANDGSGVYGECTIKVVNNECKHDFKLVESVKATCLTGGYDLYKCSKCELTKKEKITDALGHKIEVDSETGEYHCTREGCDYYFLDDKGKTQIWTDGMFVYSDKDLTSLKRLTKTKIKEELAEEENPNAISIPSKVKTIESGAFKDETFIKTVKFNSDVIVGTDAFFGCVGLTEVDGGNNNIVIKTGAFVFYGIDVHVDTIFKNCKFIVKTGNTGIKLETYGSYVTFDNCSFVVNATNTSTYDSNVATTGILVGDTTNSTEKTIILFKNCDISVKYVKGNIATLVQVYQFNPNNLYVGFDAETEVTVDEGDTMLFYTTAGSTSNCIYAYADTESELYSVLGYLYGYDSIYEVTYTVKDFDEFETDTAESEDEIIVKNYEEMLSALTNNTKKKIVYNGATSVILPTGNVSIDLNGNTLYFTKEVTWDTTTGNTKSLTIKNGIIDAEDNGYACLIIGYSINLSLDKVECTDDFYEGYGTFLY